MMMRKGHMPTKVRRDILKDPIPIFRMSLWEVGCVVNHSIDDCTQIFYEHVCESLGSPSHSNGYVRKPM